ncbi:MAG: pitrilysin family protein [Pseudomonadota bacterium]
MIRAIFAFLFLALPAQAEVAIQKVTSPGGIEAWLVEEPSIPFAALEIWFEGGAALDADDKRGAAYLMMGLLEEGSGDMDARAFATAQESLAASFGFDVYDETTVISAQFLTENRDASLALLKQALTTPRFDQVALDRVRAQVLSILASDAKDPDTIASRTFDELAFGDHPYAKALEGTPETVAALTRQDMVDAHERILTKDRMYVGAVGDITAAELGLILDDLFGDMPISQGGAVPETTFDLAGGVTVVDQPFPQSVALFGQAGIDRDDPDFFAAFILNHVLGAGGFESRLTQEVREERGLTYSIGTFLVGKEEANIYMGQMSSANDRIGQAIDVVKAEWAKAAEHGVTAEELDAAQTYLTGAYPLRFDGNAKIAGILAGMQRQDLPIDYIATRNDKVNAVTLADVNRVAGELLDPDTLHFVIVGQPEGF